MENRLLELLKIELSEIHQGFEKASIEGKGTPQEVADRREELIRAFFEKYFPFPFRTTKGNIIDSYGLSSASIDCVILDPSHPYTIDTTNKRPSVILADGVDYAVEVKGSLKSEDEIERLIKQIRSVKTLTRKNCGVFFEDERTPYDFKIPCVIYAEETYSDIKTLVNMMFRYYEKEGIKRIEQFDILVSGDFAILNSHPHTINLRKKQGILVSETHGYTLGVMLYWMMLMPIVQPQFCDDVLSHYLISNSFFAKHLHEFDETLVKIESL